MKSLLKIGAVVVFASIASAADVKVEAVVLDLPNAAADKLVQQGLSGDAEPWKALISPDGSLAQDSGAKLVARFEAIDFKEGKATQTIKHETPDNLIESFFYQVSAKDTAVSTRMIGVSLRLKEENTFPLKNWRIELGAPLTKEWSFSARHRSKDSSRIVLEKASVLPDFEKAGSSRLAFRMIERSKPVAKREQKLTTKEFAPDPDEFYRIEWRFRQGAEIHLSHESTVSLDYGKTVIDIDKEANRHGPAGERAYFNRKAGGYTSRVSSDRHLGTKGRKTRMLNSDASRSTYEIDPAPVAIQRPAKQVVQEYKGNVGQGKEQSSRIVTEFLAD
jgi:hypothetical protein